MNLLRLFTLFLILISTLRAWSLEMIAINTEDQAEVEKIWNKLNAGPSAADEIIRVLMQTKHYQNVSIYKSTNNEYVVYGERLQKVISVEIDGDRHMEETDILNALAIKPGSSYDKRKVEAGIERLREMYGRNGYFNVEFKVNIDLNENDDIKILLEIRENQPCVVKKVDIVTANKFLEGKLKRYASSLKGENFSDKEVREFEDNVTKYLRDNRYLNARLLQKDATYSPQKTEAYLTYEIRDPYYFRIEITGNTEEVISRGDLIRAVEFENFDRTSLNPAAEIADKMKSHYINKGYAFVKISFTTDVKPDDYIHSININIEEGHKIKIDKIDISGRISRPAKYYRNFILENSSEAVSKSIYVKEDLELGYRNLITALNNEGYLKAKILSARADFDNKKDEVYINLLLDEGPLTRVNKIDISGNKNYPNEELLNILGLKVNDPLRLNRLESGLTAIIDHYNRNGYIEAKILTPQKEIVNYREKDSNADIKVQLHEGPQVFVRDIIVEGNNFTKDYVVLKQIGLKSGDMLTPEKMDDARKRLIAMDIFSRVEIHTLEQDTMTSQRVLLVSVSEKNPGTFKIGMGVNNKLGITARGYSSISYSNLGGTGRGISLRGIVENNLANTDIRSYDVALSYLEPFLFDPSTRGRVEVSRQVAITGKKNAESLDGKTTNKLAFYAEKEFTKHIKLIWNTWSLESIKTYKVPNDPNEVSQQQVATIGPTLDLDYRDDIFVPTKGLFTRLEADYSSPELGSSDKITFVRTQATFSFYKDLYKKKLIWANSIRGGYAKNLNNEDGSGIPDSYAFFLGGYTTIRGYSGFDDDRIPSDDEILLSADNQLIIPDETSYRLFKTELRFPIYGSLGGVLFYDAGAVTITNKLFQGESNAMDRTFEGQAAGFGIRFNTPVGPLSLDYGRKINSDSEEKDQLHLSIGAF